MLSALAGHSYNKIISAMTWQLCKTRMVHRGPSTGIMAESRFSASDSTLHSLSSRATPCLPHTVIPLC